jgi:hypothetical protein
LGVDSLARAAKCGLSELDEGQIVGREFIVSGRDTPTLLDLAEEPFN